MCWSLGWAALPAAHGQAVATRAWALLQVLSALEFSHLEKGLQPGRTSRASVT